MEKIEHIGIAVRNLAAANRLFTRLLRQEPYKTEEVQSEGVVTSFFKLGDLKIELLAATRDDSAIATFIEKKGEGIHHLAFAVNDLEAELKISEANDFKVIGQPKPGADNKLICFLHPKSTGGVLVELCEEMKGEKVAGSYNQPISK